ncbi:MAG: cation diffusion facilitator family transporter [Alphaproteobacteria bacterium]|nr:cation diffusion facilitator family transporter [Alphaproteobacteria bacterium]
MAASEKQKVAFFSMLASALLAGSKLIAAVFTGSLGILSEAIHSVIDFGATIITWFAIRWSDQPPDEEHHYGHAKIESIAALVETGLLFVTTGWIVWEAVHRLWTGDTHVEVTWWAIAIIAVSILIDFNRSRALNRVAKKTSSEALEADALHFSSDMWSSIVVLLGLGAVWAGVPAADSIAALVVSVFIAVAGWQLGARTLRTLLDTAPEGATKSVRAIVEGVDGVLEISSLRLRPSGPTLFASVVVEVARTMPIDDIVILKDLIRDRIHQAFPHVDLTVTANPVPLDSETVFQKVMLIASRRNLAIHHLTVQQINGRLAVSFDLEVDGDMPLATAHDTATVLEIAIRKELGADVEVESHIEPQPEHLLEGGEAEAKVADGILKLLNSLTKKQPRLSELHNVRIRENDHGLFVHYHCCFDGAQTVESVHDDIDRIEANLKEKFPRIRRVIAHAEPVGRARHKL